MCVSSCIAKRLFINLGCLAFYPPVHRAGMRALLDHSVQNYGPLPSELRPHRVRSRTHSRPSPYPPRSRRTSLSSSIQTQTPPPEIEKPTSVAPPVLQQVTINPNIAYPVPPVPKHQSFTPVEVKELKRENTSGLTANVRPRVGSGARRTALGWSKRNAGKSSTENKENICRGSLST
jgi:serine/arginine repetitive matrix protein 2